MLSVDFLFHNHQNFDVINHRYCMALQIKPALNTSLRYTSTNGLMPRNGMTTFKKEYLSAATKLYTASSTIGTSNTVIDCTALTDPDGATFNLAVVTDIGIINDSANTITVCGSGGSNHLLNEFTIAPGKAWQLGTSITTSGSIKNLNVKASTAGSAVRIFIAGTTS